MPLLFWVRNYRQDNVLIPANHKIESPTTIQTSLPNVVRLIVLLRPQGGMPKLVKQKSELLGERLAHFGAQCHIVFVSAVREADFHLRFFGFLFRLPALRS